MAEPAKPSPLELWAVQIEQGVIPRIEDVIHSLHWRENKRQTDTLNAVCVTLKALASEIRDAIDLPPDEASKKLDWVRMVWKHAPQIALALAKGTVVYLGLQNELERADQLAEHCLGFPADPQESDDLDVDSTVYVDQPDRKSGSANLTVESNLTARGERVPGADGGANVGPFSLGHAGRQDPAVESMGAAVGRDATATPDPIRGEVEIAGVGVGDGPAPAAHEIKMETADLTSEFFDPAVGGPNDELTESGSEPESDEPDSEDPEVD